MSILGFSRDLFGTPGSNFQTLLKLVCSLVIENIILLASSDNDKHMLTGKKKKKNVKKDSPTTWEMTICQVKTGLGVNQFSKAKIRYRKNLLYTANYTMRKIINSLTLPKISTTSIKLNSKCWLNTCR